MVRFSGKCPSLPITPPTTNHIIQGKIWLLGLSRHNICTIITILMSLSTQLLNRQARKSHARVWTLTDRLCTRTFRVCTPTLLKSERFAAQRGSDPLVLGLIYTLFMPANLMNLGQASAGATRQSEMANTSPAPCQCLATFTPLKSKKIEKISWCHFSARSSFYIINWYGYPRGSHEKHLKEIVSPVFEIRHWIVTC